MLEEWGSSLGVEMLRARLAPFVGAVRAPAGVPGLLLGEVDLGVDGSGGRDWFKRWRVLIGNFVLSTRVSAY